MSINLTSPVGRIVQGELWKAQPVVDPRTNVPKLGADNKPLVQHFFALAIPKTPGHTHWAQTDWGQKIWAEGNRAHPNFAPHPTFSWKVEDGDSQVPNKKGKKNADREGFPGHWVIKLRSGFPPKTYNADGSAELPAESFKPGNYAQVNINVAGNTGDSPGVYLNPVMAALAGYGTEIQTGPDVAEAGFGQGVALPAGASAVPVGGFAPPTPGTPPAAPAYAPPAGVPAAPYPPVGVPTASPSSVPVPNPAFLGVPPPPAAPVRNLTAKAAGATYEALIAAGWNDALLIQNGLMLP
jgi:hypothetical protein